MHALRSLVSFSTHQQLFLKLLDLRHVFRLASPRRDELRLRRRRYLPSAARIRRQGPVKRQVRPNFLAVNGARVVVAHSKEYLKGDGARNDT